MIEYLAPHGAAWNPYTGCLHGQAECPVSARCWARGLSRRFIQICGGDFKPRFHPERLAEPLHWRRPRRVAVCFLGDLFGNWDDAHGIALEPSIYPNRTMTNLMRGHIRKLLLLCPQHIFLFLTKCPENLAQWNPWPPNAWVGTTITGAETPERQMVMLEALGRVQGASVRWLSYEPAIERLAVTLPTWLNWIVIGGFSGKRPLSAQGHAGIEDAILMAETQHIPFWLKNNVLRHIAREAPQTLP